VTPGEGCVFFNDYEDDDDEEDEEDEGVSKGEEG
jgi:hypothetical protein